MTRKVGNLLDANYSDNWRTIRRECFEDTYNLMYETTEAMYSYWERIDLHEVGLTGGFVYEHVIGAK